MLAYKNRFHGYNSLRYVYKNGQIVRSKYMTLKYSHNPRRKTPRVSVVVSKKVLKSAVGRNRIRRRIYEQIRHVLPQCPPQRDIVCIVTSAEVKTIESERLKQVVLGVFKEANLYTEV